MTNAKRWVEAFPIRAWSLRDMLERNIVVVISSSVALVGEQMVRILTSMFVRLCLVSIMYVYIAAIWGIIAKDQFISHALSVS